MSSSRPSRHANSNSEKTITKIVDLDTVLKEEIGEIGSYQFRTFALLCVLAIFRGWCTGEYIYTTGRINTRCYVEGCDTDSSEFAPEWLWGAVGDAGGAPASCQRYANISALPADGSCPAHLFNSSLLQPCDSYVYENTNTVVYDFDLGCDEWRRSIIGSIRMIAMYIALPLTGYISDRWGRRAAVAFNSINAAWLGIIRYWANSYTVYVLSVFLESTFAAGIYTSICVLSTEITGVRYRAIGTALASTFVSLGQILLAAIASVCQNWRYLTLALYAPQFLSIGIALMLNESVRWMLNKGHYEKAEKLLKNIAKDNNKDISPETLKLLRRTYEEEKLIKSESENKNSNKIFFLLYIIRNRSILLRCMISAVVWVTSLMLNYGLTLNATSITGNLYLNIAASSFVEIPSNWIGIYMLNKIGRKPVLSGAFLACAATQVTYVFISKENYALALSVYLAGKFIASIIALTTYLYTTELYPTEHRHKFLAYSAFMGRIGAVIAPLTPAFAAATFPEFPFVLFGSCALLAGLLTLLLPETRGTQLPDTLREAARIGKDNE